MKLNVKNVNSLGGEKLYFSLYATLQLCSQFLKILIQNDYSSVHLILKLSPKKEREKEKEMHACTMFLFPWGSLEAMEFSDPETKPSPNQLADIGYTCMHLSC